MVIEEKPGTVDESGVILCPQCGANNVHILAPKLLDAPNDYSKGIGVLFGAACEHCDLNDFWRMYVGHHKGCTYLSWIRERAYGN
jgi:hypothetical protein